MEFVGKVVKKSFPGFGVYSGVVESFDPAAGYFKVLYEDGDSEEVDFGEIAALLLEMGEQMSGTKQIKGSKRGRKPKKQRRLAVQEGQGFVGEDDDLGGGENLICENGGLKFDEETSGGVSEESCDFDVRRVAENGVILEDDNGGRIGLNERVEMNHTKNDTELMHSGRRSLKRHASYTAYLEGRKQEEIRKINFGNENYDGGNCSVGGISQDSKRRRISDNNFSSLTETSLRRSTRRGSINVLADIDCGYDIESGSRDVETELPCEIPKPELPPSSKDLDLDGLPVLDFFSVYAFLRSFSRVLFLSPFSLQAFLAALRSKSADSLIDAVHFSILQALRQHLQFLSLEGSDSASSCLRNLNWALLDLATWPLYLFEYILICGPKIDSLLKHAHSKLLNKEYYLLPTELKLDILRCLCDGLLEAETFRSDLCLRMTQVDVDVDSWNIMTRKKNESLANGMTEESADGNSDECILCGMDGSLICCDGCPAAFHSKCVGIAQDLLPEGDWFCPECLVDKSDGLTKFLKSSRGAEILGTDPHGRLYFSSCGYLLVLDSCESVSSYLYSKDDLNILIKMLKLSHASYGIIANTISTYWGITADTSESIIQPQAAMTDIVEVFNSKSDSKTVVTSNEIVVDDHIVQKQSEDLNLSEDRLVGTSAPDLNQFNLISSDQSLGMSSLCEVAEPTAEMTHVVDSVNVHQQASIDCSNVGSPVNGDCCSESIDIASLKKKSFQIGGWISKESPAKEVKESIMRQQADHVRYVNYYIFGLLASSVAKELLVKSAESNFKESKSDDFVSRQLKAISKVSSNLCWYSDLKLSLEVKKERCGWCHLCRTPDSTDCTFILMDGKRLDNSKSRLVGPRSEKKRKSHLISAIHQLLSIEDRLRGFLSGPWDHPNYSSQWRNTVSKASRVMTLGHMLVILEMNLRRVALSPEWTKLTDSASKVGSGFCILSGPVDLKAACSGSRKQGKRTMHAVDFDSLLDIDLSHICWWRGGRLSRQVFHWKMLPKSLVLKSARQAGCKKISALTYPDGSDFPRRSKFVAWRASVEMSKTVSQLIFQIKELDSYIRWSEFYKTPPSLQLTKESKTIDRIFKKVIIRKRRTDGECIQYLIDFGKRQNIPPIVTKYGIMLEEPSCERKKFWLGELHVPLYLVKSFEERKIAQALKKAETKLLSGSTNDSILGKGKKSKGKIAQSSKKSVTKLLSGSANDCILEKGKKSKGLSRLMSKGEKLDNEVCVQCNKDVLIRDAVVCHECKGLFHKKHFKMAKGGLATKYTCFSCKLKETDKLILKMKETAKLVLEEKEPDKLVLEKNEAPDMVLEKRQIDKLMLKKKGAAKWVLEKEGKTDNMVLERESVMSKTSLQKEDSEKNKSPGSTLTMVLRKKKRSVVAKSKKQTHGTKQRKTSKTKKIQLSETDTIRNASKRKRTTRPSIFWLNGLLWSRNPDDKRGENFRNKRVGLPSQNIENTAKLPVCCLCLKEFSPEMIYVGCESCDAWFHGDIYNLSTEDIHFLMGFKCPKCQARSIPCCPFSVQSATAEDMSPTKSILADRIVHEDQKSIENYKEKSFHGPSDIPEQLSLNRGKVVEVKNEGMEVMIAESESESSHHLPFVSPAMVENQHPLDQENDCNLGKDEDMLDVEVLKAEAETESYGLQSCEPPVEVQSQHSLDQEKDVNLGVDADMPFFITESEIDPRLPFVGLAEDEAISLKHADDNHIIIVANKTGHDKNKTVEIPNCLQLV